MDTIIMAAVHHRKADPIKGKGQQMWQLHKVADVVHLPTAEGEVIITIMAAQGVLTSQLEGLEEVIPALRAVRQCGRAWQEKH
jgi:hypothetical protein